MKLTFVEATQEERVDLARLMDHGWFVRAIDGNGCTIYSPRTVALVKQRLDALEAVEHQD